ncbi:MAG: FMN-binding protein [Psychroserpens sp.]|jgi:Na+-translocating ferredoxin:NAD+ oxidoreductase RnfG subunit|nr:FMN-binding protein [Psychroserpens sp.]
MRFIHSLITCFFFLFVTSGLTKSIQKKVEKEIKSTYNVEEFVLKPKAFDAEIINILPSEFDADNFFEIQNEGLVIGYAYVSKAPSKTDEFDYLILLNKEVVIQKAKVLVYREDYGGEIGSKRWLQQFIGKTPTDELKYQQNIVAISGATISVRSMTTAVNDLLRSLHILQTKNQL